MSSTKRTPAHSAYNLPEAAAAEVAAAAAEATAAAAADAPVPGSEAAAAEEDAPVPAVAEAVPTVVAEGATAVEAAAVAAASGSGGAAAAAAAAAEAGAVGYGLNLAGFGLANQSASESKNLADRIAEYQPEAIVSLLLGIKDFVDAAAIAAGSSAAAGRYALVRAIGWVIGGFAASRYYARSAKPCFDILVMPSTTPCLCSSGSITAISQPTSAFRLLSRISGIDCDEFLYLPLVTVAFTASPG